MARPKRVFTEQEEAMIADYALDGGKNNTIAMALDMPVNTLTNRFSGLLKKYRSIRKLKLARNQTKQSVDSPQMAIFLGKNELEQTDKQTIEHKGAPTLAPEVEKASKAAAETFKQRLAREGIEERHVQRQGKTA